MIHIFHTPQCEIINISHSDPVHFIANCARVSHQSKGDEDTELVKKLISWGHLSPFEHVTATVDFTTDVKLSMALLRHRMTSPIQESTRYCNYADEKKFPKGLEVFAPTDIYLSRDQDLITDWLKGVDASFQLYKKIVSEYELPPELARTVLPMCTATQTVITANLREWRYIIQTRITKGNHPDMRQLMRRLLRDFKEEIPYIFDDIRSDDDDA